MCVWNYKSQRLQPPRYHLGQEFQILYIYSLVDDNIPAPLKNAIDWASRPPNVWGDKAAAIISVSAGMGGARGQLHLRQIGVFLDLHFINKPEFFLNAFQPPAKFDSQGHLIDENTRERLKEVLLALQAFTWRLKTATNAEINAWHSPSRALLDNGLLCLWNSSICDIFLFFPVFLLYYFLCWNGTLCIWIMIWCSFSPILSPWKCLLENEICEC